MDRIYTDIIKQHIKNDQQMLFLAGSRQVGKTTIAQQFEHTNKPYFYLNWDDQHDKNLILGGNQTISEHVNLSQPHKNKTLIIFDEIHKFKNWKNFLKALYDKHKNQLNIIVTGSAKLDVYRKGSDSLMGRYFLYRIHPLSVAEIATPKRSIKQEINTPHQDNTKIIERLLKFGGYPDPYIKQDNKFLNRWKTLKSQQLFQQDLIELSNINEIAMLEQLAFQMKYLSGNQINYSSLGNKLQISATTIKSWLNILEQTYYCFCIPPWSTNIARSLTKTPKLYLWDWSDIEDPGQKTENLVASHLLKATHLWTDYGLGTYSLYYLRDKEQNEVDFLVTKNSQPWFLVEVKQSDTHLSKSLIKFQKQTQAPFAFQIVKNLPHENINCFDYNEPVVVPLSTFLSQLV